MGFLLRLIQFLAWLIFATWLGRKLLGWLFGSAAREYAQNAARGRNSAAQARGGSQLFRDPVCGMHVTEGISVTLVRAGVMHHFCSAECREKFRVMSPQDSGSKAARA